MHHYAPLCTIMKLIMVVLVQSTTGSTTLIAEDKLDDQTLIKLKILIDKEEVCRCVCVYACSYMHPYM